MRIVKLFVYILFLMSIAGTSNANCLKVKIYSKSKMIAYKDRNTYVAHFQLENCGNEMLPIDFYGNLGYPEDSICNIYFDVMKADVHMRYHSYEYARVNYKNGIDSMMQLKPKGTYLFYLPLFEVYGIKEVGYYRVQGYYRYINKQGEYIVQKSDYLDIQII